MTSQLNIKISEANPYPGEKIEVGIETLENSFVGLMAVNMNSKTLGTNELTEKRIYEEFDKFKLGDNFTAIEISKDEKKLFRTANLFVISNEKQNYDDHVICKRSVDDYNGETLTDLDENDLKYREINLIDIEDDWNSWMFKSYETQSGHKTFNFTLPEKASHYVVAGFSINQDKGLTLSKPVEINSFKDYYVEMRAPSYAAQGDVLKIEVDIMNFKSEAQRAQLKIEFSSEFATLLKETTIENECELQKDSSYEKSLQIEPNSLQTTNFYLQLDEGGDISVQISVSIGPEIIEKMKKINVKTTQIESPTETENFDSSKTEFNARFFDFERHAPKNAIENLTISKATILADHSYAKKFNLTIEFKNYFSYIINDENKHETKIFELKGHEGPSTNYGGKGKVTVKVYQIYKLGVASQTEKKYDVDLNFQNHGATSDLEICIKIKQEDEEKEVNLEVSTPTGFVYDSFTKNNQNNLVRNQII